MPDLADLFPAFSSNWIATSKGRLFARTGGSGPPLLMLHGFPQTHVMWHRVAGELARHFTLVMPDLPGYGWSDIPETTTDHLTFSKRAFAATMVEAMENLGHVRFGVIGHDRGGRVAYRLALDHPGRVTRLATLDIVPTYDFWADMGRVRTLRAYHWSFLAQPEPLPETLIGKDPRSYFRGTLIGWGRVTKDIFDPRAMEHYLKALEAPERIHAACEDYRAGAIADFEIDKVDVDAGNKIKVPMLALWGNTGAPAAAGGRPPLEIWHRWAPTVRGEEIKSGHFMAEENPTAVAAGLVRFFTEQN